MRLLHGASRTRAHFDDPNVVSCAGLVPDGARYLITAPPQRENGTHHESSRSHEQP